MHTFCTYTSVKEVVGYFIELKTPEAYYFDQQEFSGYWVGQAASLLGLKGKVDSESFERLCQNLHPHTGEPLTPITRDGRRLAQDHVFGPPKSVSLAYAYTGDERIIEAIRSAGLTAITEGEKFMQTRVRKNGQDYDRPTHNLVASEHIHLTTRPVDGFPDPHVHVHYVIFNVTYDPVEKQFKAAQMAEMVDHTVYLDKLFLATLAQNLKKLGLKIVPTEHSFEIEGFTTDLNRRYSRRTTDIEATAARLGITDPAQKAKLGATTRERKARSLLMSDLKEYWFNGLSPADEEVFKAVAVALKRSRQKDLGAEISFVPKAETGPDSTVEKTSEFLGRQQTVAERKPIPGGINNRTRPQVAKAPEDVEVTEHDRRAVEFAIKHIFQRHSLATLTQVQAEAFNGWNCGRATWQGVEQVLAKSPLLRKRVGEKIFVTTREVLEEENRLIERCLDGKWKFEAMQPAWTIRDERLNAQQRNAVLHVATSRDRVVGIAGLAGTGKTTLLKELQGCLEDSGFHILALAPSAEASRERLREVGFDNAETVAQLFSSQDLQAEGKGAVWLVDEAGLLSTRDGEKLLKLAEELNARVVLIGDTGQHHPVERGQAFDLLERFAHLSVARVDEIQRQKGRYKEFVKHVVARDIAGAFDILKEMGALKEMSIEERQVALAEDYVNAVERGRSALVVAPTHRECEEVVGGIRSRLKERNHLKGCGVEWEVLKDLSWTDAQKEYFNSYEKGQVVQFNSRVKGFQLGERVEVVGVRDEVVRVRRKFTLRDEVKALPLDEAQHFNVYEKEKIEICAGEKVRITLNSRTEDRHRVSNGNEYGIDYIDYKGRLVLENGWRLGKTFPHLEYAYPLTSHSSQSRSVDSVFLAQTAKFSAPAMDLAQFYVSSTRARSEIKLYADNIPLVQELVSRVRERPMAMELFSEQGEEKRLADLFKVENRDSSAELGQSEQISAAMVAEMERLKRKKKMGMAMGM